jgi:hypothetical protein
VSAPGTDAAHQPVAATLKELTVPNPGQPTVQIGDSGETVK